MISTSGTTTLEAMLMGKPMVIAYKFHWLTYALGRRLFKAPFFGLPNLLAEKMLAPELLQDAATPEAIADETLAFSNDDTLRIETIEQFLALRTLISKNASETAATSVLALLEQHHAS